MFFHEERITGNKDKRNDVPVDKENEKLKQRLFAGVDSAPLIYAKAIRLVKKKNKLLFTTFRWRCDRMKEKSTNLFQ